MKKDDLIIDMSEEIRSEQPLHYDMKIRIYHVSRNFGPGTAELMQRVLRTGSLSAACREMKMAYSKAWKIIRFAERDLGFPLMESTRGGENGGNTVLTEEGRELLERYLAFTSEAEAELDRLFEKHFGQQGQQEKSR